MNQICEHNSVSVFGILNVTSAVLNRVYIIQKIYFTFSVFFCAVFPNAVLLAEIVCGANTKEDNMLDLIGQPKIKSGESQVITFTVFLHLSSNSIQASLPPHCSHKLHV